MAATKIDPVAAKQAKQKKLLIVLSVVLVAVMAIQLPRIMGGSKPAAAAAGATGATGAAGVAPVAPAATPPPAAPAKLTIGEVSAKPGKAQLASFSLFAAKDPFVPKIKDAAAAGGLSAGATGVPAGGSSGIPAPGSGVGIGIGGTGGTGGGGTPAASLSFVTLAINGETQSVQVKGLFPLEDPLFRLVAVSAKSVKIGIAGGKLTRGKAVSLRLGKKLTLVNTATGARYVIQLLYVGAAPERTATFEPATAPTGQAPQPPAGPAPVSQTATAP